MMWEELFSFISTFHLWGNLVVVGPPTGVVRSASAGSCCLVARLGGRCLDLFLWPCPCAVWEGMCGSFSPVCGLFVQCVPPWGLDVRVVLKWGVSSLGYSLASSPCLVRHERIFQLLPQVGIWPKGQLKSFILLFECRFDLWWCWSFMLAVCWFSWKVCGSFRAWRGTTGLVLTLGFSFTRDFHCAFARMPCINGVFCWLPGWSCQ